MDSEMSDPAFKALDVLATKVQGQLTPTADFIDIGKEIQDIRRGLQDRGKRITELEQRSMELEATLSETIIKAAFVDKMCKEIGVTFQTLTKEGSVIAALGSHTEGVRREG